MGADYSHPSLTKKMKSMKRFIFTTIMFVCAIAIYAQKYIVDAVIADHTVATTDEYRWDRSFLSQSTYEAAQQTGGTKSREIEIPNGTEVIVLQFDRTFHTQSNAHAKAKILYQDDTYYIHARDLVFSPDNPEGTFNALDTLFFSPNEFHTAYVDESGQRTTHYVNTLDLHSSEARLLYSSILPICILVLILVAFTLIILAARTKKERLLHIAISSTPLLMIAIVALESYLLIRLGREATWFIDPDFFTKGTCTWRSIPLIAAIVLQIVSFYIYCTILPVREGKTLKSRLSLKSTLITIIPAVVAGYFLATVITGYDRSTSDATNVGITWIVWFALTYIFLLIWPTIYYSRNLDAGSMGHKSQFLLGLSTSAFMVVYWIGTIALIFILAFAIMKLLLAILAQIFLWVVMLGVCGSKFGAKIFKRSGSSVPVAKYYDKSGGQHLTEIDASYANNRIDKAREANSPTFIND